MDEFIKKSLIDVKTACEEVESFFGGKPKLFEEFSADTMKVRAVERNVEIMGEAINRIKRIDPDFELPNARAIIQTRNRVIHGYDSVTKEFLWGLVIKHIPNLLNDVDELLKQ